VKKETLQAPAGAMGPASYYAQAAKAGPFLFLAGIGGFDSENRRVIRSFDDIPGEECKKLRSGDWHIDTCEETIMAQTWWMYTQIKKVLEGYGSSLEDVMQTIIFIRDMRKNFAPFSRVRMMFVKDPPPSTIVETPRLGMTDDLLVEMSTIALIPDEK